ncbi:MAG: tetratricopeptide repeat protein [Chitinophagales bacterium]
MSFKCIFFWFLLLLPILNFAQSSEAIEYANTAKKHMVKGEYKEAAKNYEKALKNDKKNDEYCYQLALAYYRQSKFADAIEYLQTIIQQPAEKLEYYRLLANAYDLKGDYEQSTKILQKALKQYPTEAELYFDWGVIEWLRKKPQVALDKWEQGIKIDPNYPDNYFWAAKVYATSNEPLWTLLYGELFMNIERNGGDRFNEMGKLVLDTYLCVLNDTLPEPKLLLERTKSNSFENAHNELQNALKNNKVDNSDYFDQIQSVTNYRERFLELWQQGFDKTYPTPLYTYHQELINAGNFESYNYWLFNQANIRDYNLWIQTFEGKKGFQNFMSWYLTHPIRIHTQSFLVRTEYVE